ncbi:MAG TPA: UTP--glucose-1-phosphate uridylyltransferase, partial [Patescibacteria group bacterium]|nr:UTP--glucose-1-phosphate uridylyltransferase [Patescibacteria group bacterium]
VDAIKKLAEQRPVYACKLKNTVWCDTGNKLEYIKTIIHFAMKRKEYREELGKYMAEIIKK